MPAHLLDASRTLRELPLADLLPLCEPGPLIRVHCPDGQPRAATSVQLVAAPEDDLWAVVADLHAFPRFVNMVDSVRLEGGGPAGEERLRVNLRFKITLFSARFDFLARVQRGPGRAVELAYVSGKVKDVIIRLETTPAGPDRSLLLCHVGFDQTSLGWLVNVFIRHHPEIDWGVHAGSTMSIASSIRRMAEHRRAAAPPAGAGRGGPG